MTTPFGIGSYTQRVIDTALAGYEYVLIQRLLARALGVPLPVVGVKVINYGISVTLAGEIFQILEKVTWQERLKIEILVQDCGHAAAKPSAIRAIARHWGTGAPEQSASIYRANP